MEELRDVVAQIEALTQEPGFIYTLSFILARDLFSDPDEAASIDWRARLSFRELAFLVGLMVKHAFTLDIPDETESEERFERTYRLFLDLHEKHNEPFVKALRQSFAPKGTDEPAGNDHRKVFNSARMMTEPIFYGGSGAYDFQYLEFAKRKYDKDEAWIVAHKGISVSVMVDIARTLKTLHERKFMECLSVQPAEFSDICRAALSIFCFTPEELSDFAKNQVRSFIDAFSLVPGQVNGGLEFPGHYNEAHSHPIIAMPDGRYFLPIGFDLCESIYESPFYWMSEDPTYAPTAFRNRGQFAEAMTSHLLKAVFGHENVHTQVQVKKNKQTTLTDIDVLAIAGNKAVIAQVKSKRLTELARTGDDERLEADFKSAVQGAYNQALLSRAAILENGNTLVEDGTTYQLSEHIDDAYVLCLTLDHYPAVTRQVDVYLKRKNDDPLPVALSIFDLDILTYYLKDPFEFVYYLRQRTKLGGHFKADSEITLLAYHLTHKLFGREDVDREALDNSFAQLIDANFPVLRGAVPGAAPVDKLRPDWKNNDFEKLIAQIKSTEEPGFADALFMMYDLAGKGADQLIGVIKRVKSQTKKDGRSHDAALLLPNAGVTVLSEANVDILREKLIPFARLRKYKARVDVWLALGCVGSSPNLVDAVAFNKKPWTEDPRLEQLVSKFFPGSGTAVTSTATKPGRNDLCPCGSGKKYKRCHGR